MVFRLPRLQNNIRVVNRDGTPALPFMRWVNVDFAGAIETQEAGQTELIEQLAAAVAAITAAQAAADAAQATADAALAAAEAGGGAKYATLTGASPAARLVSDVPVSVQFALSGGTLGATLDADADLIGTVTLHEVQGASDLLVATAPITITSSGLFDGTAWVANDASYQLDGFGTLDSAVTYRLTVARTSGSNFVNPGTVNATLTLTPEAP